MIPKNKARKPAAFADSYCSPAQREIMDWGRAHVWPDVYVQGKMRYAVAAGAESWSMSVIGARQDMVDALYETLVAGRRAQLSADDSANVQRVLDLIEE